MMKKRKNQTDNSQFDNFISTHKAVSLRIDCFFHTQKGVIGLCV